MVLSMIWEWLEGIYPPPHLSVFQAEEGGWSEVGRLQGEGRRTLMLLLDKP